MSYEMSFWSAQREIARPTPPPSPQPSGHKKFTAVKSGRTASPIIAAAKKISDAFSDLFSLSEGPNRPGSPIAPPNREDASSPNELIGLLSESPHAKKD